MEKWITLIAVMFLMTAGIQAQGGGSLRRMMFLRQRQLALRRAFPFGVPLTMRGGIFPSRFSTRFQFPTVQRAFRFGPDPFTMADFGTPRFIGTPFGTSPAFSPNFFQGQRFGTPSPFGTGAFGATGTPGFFPGGDGFPAGNGFADGRMPPTGSGFPPATDMGGMNGQTTGSQTPSDTTGGVGGTDQGGPTRNQNDLNDAGSGQTFQGSNNIFPDFNSPRPDVGPVAGQFPSGAGQFPTGTGQFPSGTGQFPSGTGQFSSGTGQFPMGGGQFPSGPVQFPTRPDMGGSMNALTPMFPTTTAFGQGFGQPGTRPLTGDMTSGFPGDRTGGLQGDRTSGFQGDRLNGFSGDWTSGIRDPRMTPNSQFQNGPSRFGPGFGQSDRSRAAFPQGQGAMARESSFGQGPSPFGVTPAFQGMPPFTGPFPRDPRFAGFGQTGRFAAGPGPEFNTLPGNPADPNFNQQFQSLPGGSPFQGQFGGSAGQNQFPVNQDMGNPNINENNFNNINNNNNQIVPTGNQAAPIDGFGAVTSNNNININENTAFSTNTNENPAGIIQFETGTSSTQPDVVVSDAKAPVAGSNEFRVVEVGNILDTRGGDGRVTVSSSDQSVVDSMGFQAAENTNIVAQEAPTTAVLTDGGPSNINTDNVSLPSPINQDFSFFVPSDNSVPATEPQGGATFTVPAPPPPPPIMVANNNNQQPGPDSNIQDTHEMVGPLDLFGIGPFGADSFMFPIDGTEHRRIGDPQSKTGIAVTTPDVTTPKSRPPSKVEEKPTTTSATLTPMDIANNVI